MFENPYYLLFLWVVPPAVLLLYYEFRRRKRAAGLFVDPVMFSRLLPATENRRFVRNIFFLAVLILIGITLAGPRFGSYLEEVEVKGADIFVLLDVSRSMLAEDLPPNRLARAKSDIRALLDRLIGDRIGLIAFAGKPVIRVPLTTDRFFFLDALEKIDTNSAPRGGTAIGDAIRLALTAMREEPHRDRVILLITDGEDHDSFPREAAQEAASLGIKLILIALGDAVEGGRIPVNSVSGQQGFLQYEGREVWSKSDEKLLETMARETGGVYIPAGLKAYDLGKLYKEHLLGLNESASDTEKRTRYRERYQMVLAFAVLLLAWCGGERTGAVTPYTNR